MKKILLATHNKGKVRELAELIEPLGFEVISAEALNLPEPEETGSTFHANAKLKAVAAATAANMTALADDSGVCIAALNGEPGIYSARWGGPEKDFKKACDKIRSELAKQNLGTGADAYFICVLSLANPDGSSTEFEGRCYGKLTFPARGAEGFGYDPIFIPEHASITFGEMTAEEKNRKNHRTEAFDKFKDYLLKLAA